MTETPIVDTAGSGTAGPATTGTPLLEVRDLRKEFPVRGPLGRRAGAVTAVGGISFTLNSGECYGLVGESGCGKTTTGRMLQGLLVPTGGSVSYRGTPLSAMSRADLRQYRSDVQMIFQDPYSSLNPRRRVGAILGEALRIQGGTPGREIRPRVVAALEAVGLGAEHLDRYPHEFSGGQRQRIGIARALMVSPRIILCDEPVSALDVSIQAQILNLLGRLQRELNVTYLFISHDLGVVRHVADRVGVMYRGELVEENTTTEIFSRPQHPYTKALLAAVPARHPAARRRRTVEGTGA